MGKAGMMSDGWRRTIVALLALLAGTATFLRLPLNPRPIARQQPVPVPAPWTPFTPLSELATLSLEASRAEASTPPDEPRQPRFRPLPPAPVAGPFVYRPPSGARLQPLVGSDASIFSFIEYRLSELDELGDESARADTLYMLGVQRQQSGDFAAAADYFEAFAGSAECGLTCDEMAASLENAIVLRRSLSRASLDVNDVHAVRLAHLFAQRFTGSHPRAATRVMFEVSAIDPDSRAALQRRRLPPAERIQTSAREGLRLWNTDRTRARSAFRRAERVWRRSGGALMATSPGLSPTEWILELSRTREALAEGRFVQANLQFRHALAGRLPEYKGPVDTRRQRRWLRTQVAPWAKRRERRIRRAERALDRVDQLGLSTFSVPAAARRGELYQRFEQDLRRVLRQVDIELDAQETESLRWRSLAHFRGCMELASITRNYGDWSERCADGLAEHDSRYVQSEMLPVLLLAE